jgi:tetratricopeptide (TPR) repeat protein
MRLEIQEIDSTCPTLCLNMIVKNESKIIHRLLESVYPIINCYCICDTGSTDNTIELIETFFSEKNIPGKVIREPFKNFAHNRSFALQACSGMSDYAILLDADMILEVNEFDKHKLAEADSFCLLQGNDSFYYQNMRIVRNNGFYKYTGVTHEYISTPSGNHNINIGKNELFIRDIGDGGSKSDKFERDIRLLLEGLNEEPGNVRYHFYLANSYKDSGQFEKAIEYYQKRISLGDWEQEIWYSYYNIANIYEAQCKMSDAVIYWLKAYNHNPLRLENVHKLVQYYRIIGECKTAKMFYDIAKNALKQNIKKDDYLFLANDVYTYKFEYEYSIIACYLGISNINDAIVSIFNNTSDSNIINNLFSNMKFYKDVLKPKQVLDFSFTREINVRDKSVPFYSSSPSILPKMDKSGYMMNIRAVNYWINVNGGYLNCDEYIFTNNKYVELDNNFQITYEKLFDVEFEDRHYLGIEDIRIFRHDTEDKLVYLGTSQHKDGKIGMLMGDYDIAANCLTTTEVKPSFIESWCEKNWVHVNYKNENHVIYKWSPLDICKINTSTNQLDLVESKSKMPKIFEHVRGSTPGFAYNNEFWFILHLVAYDTPRNYYHIFAVFDNELNFLRHSAPFKFEGENIEYSLGLIVEDERVLVTYSTWDRTSKLAIYDKSYVDSLNKYYL